MEPPIRSGERPHGVEDLLRELAPQVLGVLVAGPATSPTPRTPCRRRCSPPPPSGRTEGVPDNPRGWLIAVASRRLTDMWRSERRAPAPRGARHRDGSRSKRREPTPQADDSLLLLFLCCHPALPPGVGDPLTLRAVGGLTTAEIARAFLVPEPTMAQRISRAKQRIKDSDGPFRMPSRGRVAASGSAPCCTCCT